MNGLVWAGLLIVGLLSLVLPFVLLPILRRYNVLDIPSLRSSHSRPTIRGGGAAPMLALIIGGALVAGGLPTGTNQHLAIIVLLAALSAGILGLCEDITGIPIIVRVTIQLLIGVAAAVALTKISDIHWIYIPFAALAFAAYVNFTNFMDGINGISGLHGLVVGSLYGITGVLYNAPWLLSFGFATAIAFAAFLPWNLRASGIFLGDAGSYLLGALIAGCSLSAMYTGIPALVILAPLTIYLFDTVLTLASRVYKRQEWHAPHRQHVYQQLVDLGWSHIASAGVVAALTLIAGAAGLLFARESGSEPILRIAVLASVGLLYWSLPTLLKRRTRRQG